VCITGTTEERSRKCVGGQRTEGGGREVVCLGRRHAVGDKVKIKLSLCLINKARRHQDVWGVEVYLHHS
jgi:hypothetical protein